MTDVGAMANMSSRRRQIRFTPRKPMRLVEVSIGSAGARRSFARVVGTAFQIRHSCYWRAMAAVAAALRSASAFSPFCPDTSTVTLNTVPVKSKCGP